VLSSEPLGDGLRNANFKLYLGKKDVHTIVNTARPGRALPARQADYRPVGDLESTEPFHRTPLYAG
jgi:hypothetical protein